MKDKQSQERHDYLVPLTLHLYQFCRGCRLTSLFFASPSLFLLFLPFPITQREYYCQIIHIYQATQMYILPLMYVRIYLCKDTTIGNTTLNAFQSCDVKQSPNVILKIYKKVSFNLNWISRVKVISAWSYAKWELILDTLFFSSKNL